MLLIVRQKIKFWKVNNESLKLFTLNIPSIFLIPDGLFVHSRLRQRNEKGKMMKRSNPNKNGPGIQAAGWVFVNHIQIPHQYPYTNISSLDLIYNKVPNSFTASNFLSQKQKYFKTNNYFKINPIWYCLSFGIMYMHQHVYASTCFDSLLLLEDTCMKPRVSGIRYANNLWT